MRDRGGELRRLLVVGAEDDPVEVRREALRRRAAVVERSLAVAARELPDDIAVACAAISVRAHLARFDDPERFPLAEDELNRWLDGYERFGLSR